MFTGYDIGCKQILQLKKSLKFHCEKLILRNLKRKNALKRLRWSHATCINTVTLALLVTSIDVVMIGWLVVAKPQLAVVISR